MNELEDQILRHIGQHQISFAQVIEARFLEGRPCGQIMNRLAAEHRIRIRRGMPDQTPKYFQLTRSELKRRALPVWKSKRPKSQDFTAAISLLWFCNMLGPERYLLSPAHAASIFPLGIPEGTHCIERIGEEHRLYRVRVTNAEADPNDARLLKSLRKRVSTAITFPGLRPWVTTGRYAFAVLTDDSQHAERIREQVTKDELLRLSGMIAVHAFNAQPQLTAMPNLNATSSLPSRHHV